MPKSGRKHPVEGASSRNLCGDLGTKPHEGTGNSFTVQHLKEVAIDHQNGFFAGTNDLVEKLGSRPPWRSKPSSKRTERPLSDRVPK